MRELGKGSRSILRCHYQRRGRDPARKTSGAGLFSYWGNVAQDESGEDHDSGKRATAIERLKQMPVKDMVVYGGAGFVSSLVKEDLIDEYDLLVNPVAAGNSLGMFQGLQRTLQLTLIEARPFSCGPVLLRYHVG